MNKLAFLGKLLQVYSPAPIVGFLHPERDQFRGARIDPKAFAAGRLAEQLRGDGQQPTVAESRAQMNKAARMFDSKAPKLARIEDITVQGADGALKARLFCDHPAAKPCPAMVYFHVGGFIQGDLDTHREVCAKLAKWWGGMVISVDYRLAPEHPYPAGVEDAVSAYLDIAARAAELGIDPAAIGVGGDSAGACLAAVVAQQLNGGNGIAPSFQVLIYPFTDGHLDTPAIKALPDAYLLPRARMCWYRDLYAGDFTNFDDPKFSPLLAADFSGLPRAIVVTAGFDPLQDDGNSYVAKLNEAGVPVTHRHFPGQVHGFVNLTRIIHDGTQALLDVAAWLQKNA